MSNLKNRLAQVEALKLFQSKNYDPHILNEDEWGIYSELLSNLEPEEKIRFQEKFWYKINSRVS